MDRLPTQSPSARPSRGARWAAGLLALALAPSVAAQSARPDQVVRMNPRTQKTSTITGVITEDSLEFVKVDQGGRETKNQAVEIVKVTWGNVPAAFRDGVTFQNRGDFASAVAKFQLAADSAEREVVQAAARYHAAKSLLSAGASDPNQFDAAIAECDKFLADYANNRQVPHVREIKARATMLAGRAAEAAALYKALYEEGANDPATTGYSRELCLSAGISAARAFLAAGDGLAARELFAGLDPAYAGLIAAHGDETTAKHAELAGARAEVMVGEGFCLIAADQVDQAVSFFETKLTDSELPSRGQFAASLGLAEALVTKGDLRRAQIEFAKVSAIDHTDRDRAARARVGLADTTLKLQDSDATTSAKQLLTNVTSFYGDTPAAKRAAELLQKL